MDSRGGRKGEGKGGDKGEEIVDRERKMQEEERWEKIGESKYNRWYGRVKGPGVPGYLKKGWWESRWQRVAKFRFGNGMRGGRYWEEGKKGGVGFVVGGKSLGSTCGRYVWGGEWREGGRRWWGRYWGRRGRGKSG